MGLIKAFLKEGHQVVAIAPEDEYSRRLKDHGCEFIPLIIQEKGSNPIKDALVIRQLYQIYKSVKPDAVLHYTIKPNIYGSIAAKLLGIPSINNVSGLGTVFLHNNYTARVAQALYKFSFQFPKKVFFQNHDDLKLFLDKKLVNKQISDVLPGSGININTFKPKTFVRNSSCFTFLVIARLLYDKGIVEFAEAARSLKEKGINAKFQILGYTDFNTKLGIPKSLLERWVKEEIIEYLGTTDSVADFIYKADCVVLPSYREGTPRTLLEAAALAKPLIATDVPGCKEVVKNECNGFLCKVKDSQDLSEKMLRIYNLPENELSTLGKNSRRLVEETFDEEIVIRKYFEALDLPYNNLNLTNQF